MTIEAFLREGTIEIWAYFKRAGSYTSPNQGVKLTVWDSAGTVQVNAQAMSENATGKFVYYYTPAAAAEQKWWNCFAIGQHGTGDSAKYGVARGSFYLN